jgi:hypothetical protein
MTDPQPDPATPGPSTPGPSTPISSTPDERHTARVRRSPRILNFVIAGLILGVILALILTSAFPTDGEFTTPQVFGFLLLFIGTACGILGAVVALIVDLALSRRAKEIEVDRELVDQGEDPDAG